MADQAPRGWVLPAPSLSHVRHGFFTRRGGVSPAPYDTLNCSLASADLAANVAVNRGRVAGYLGVEASSLLGLTQTHSPDVVVLTHDTPVWPTGKGPKADALVSNRHDLALGVITADCGPVLFASADGSVVGAAHAGWRGAVGGVLEATLDAMQALGAGDVIACVGPCIRQAGYEVGADMRTEVLDGSSLVAPCAERFFVEAPRAGHYLFDLPGYCLYRLRRAGLRHVSTIGLDTRYDALRFFSHRRRTLAGGGAIGHQISAIRAGAVA
ncbi:polyphenol oxidase family protein [Asaia bogorensis]|uniref:polyphenol oxidase family protein n=1 Tax=Asaia bogorensis TaxID=91915 RepID=UPI00285D7833|nr:polyphenol oxidase family protein [Asaia bogorensis]MDR6183377.1 YfiH family protein [Asaia bogorensis NBRC 16594]